MHTQGDRNVNMKAETGVMLLQAKNASHHQSTSIQAAGLEQILPVDTLILDFSPHRL